MPNDFNLPVIEEFRANGGHVGGYFEGARLILLTTTGARSGRPHTVPLAYLPDGAHRLLVIGSAGGSAHHPAWYHNLLANPLATVEDGVFTYQAEATVLRGEERDRAFARAVEAEDGWRNYQSMTTRVLPVVALTEVAGGPPNASSPAEALKLVHDAFRRELSLIRKEFAESGASLGVQLRMNCLTLCQGLHNHHTGEDTMLFPHLAEHHPELGPTLDRLTVEHQRIAELVAQLQAVISAEGADTMAVLPEVERLTDELERHLDYEEAQLIPLLGQPAE